jgi:O-methyltransferase involved in polyketide biosynthesis
MSDTANALGYRWEAEWEPELLAVGFRPGRRTLWIAEGLFFYLTESTVDQLVGATVRLSGAGSAIAADARGSGLLRAPGKAQLGSKCVLAGQWAWHHAGPLSKMRNALVRRCPGPRSPIGLATC